MAAFRNIIAGLSVSTVGLLRHVQLCTAQRTYKRWVAPTLKELKIRKKKMGPQLPQHRSTYLEWNYNAELYAFGKRLNEEFNSDLLRCAFTHRSYILQEEARQKELGIENPQLDLKDNRELAAAGENFISLYIDQYTHTLLPSYPEEGIRAVNDFLMEDGLLAHISSNIGTGDLILCSDFPLEKSTLATTFKAVVGALLESSGPKQAGLFVRDFVVTCLIGKDVNDIWQPQNPVQILTAILARQERGQPEPRLIGEAGRNTILAAYQVGIYVNRNIIGVGAGETVAIATEMAALDSLRQLFKTTNSMTPFSFNMDIDIKSTKTITQNTSI